MQFTPSKIEIVDDVPAPVICFWCKKLLSECTDQSHWNKKLDTVDLSEYKGLQLGDKNQLSGGHDETWIDGLERKAIKKIVRGKITPKGHSPSELTKEKERSVASIEESAQKQLQSQQVGFVKDWIRDMPASVRRALFAEYELKIEPDENGLIRVSFSDEEKLGIVAALMADTGMMRTPSHRQDLILKCAGCGVEVEGRHNILGLMPAEFSQDFKFYCVDCMGRLYPFGKGRKRKHAEKPTKTANSEDRPSDSGRDIEEFRVEAGNSNAS